MLYIKLLGLLLGTWLSFPVFSIKFYVIWVSKEEGEAHGMKGAGRAPGMGCMVWGNPLVLQLHVWKVPVILQFYTACPLSELPLKFLLRKQSGRTVFTDNCSTLTSRKTLQQVPGDDERDFVSLLQKTAKISRTQQLLPVCCDCSLPGFVPDKFPHK